jgi:hypothetical protein
VCKQAIFLFIFLAISAVQGQANPMTYLAELSYGATHGKCPEFDKRVVDPLKKAGLEKGCLAAFKLGPGAQTEELAKASEDLFFDLGQKELKTQLQCELSKVDHLLSKPDDLSAITKDVQKKVPALKELTKEIQSRLSEFQLIYGKLPKNPDAKLSKKDLAKKAEADKLNEEVKELMLQKSFILESIPFGDHPEISEMVEGLSENLASNSNLLTQKIQAAGRELRASMTNDIEELQKSVQPGKELPRALKERMAQDPLFIKHVATKNNLELTSFEPVRCDIDAKYGTGAILRDQIGMVAGIAGTGIVVGAVTKTINAAIQLGSMTRKAGMWQLFVKANLAILPTASTAVASQCFSGAPENVVFASSMASGETCNNSDIHRSVHDNNCALAVALPILMSGLPLLAVGKEVPKLVLTLQQAEKIPAEPAPLQVVQKARRTEKVPTNQLPTKATSENPEPPKAPAVQQRKDVELPFIEEDVAVVAPEPRINHYQEMRNLSAAGRTKEAKAYRAKIEKMLKDDKMEYVGDVGKGDSNPRWVKFPDGTYGVWKPYSVSGENLGANEIATYKIDQHMGLNRVPVTVERSMNGERGTVQLVVGKIRPGKLDRRPLELRLFDDLTTNEDRNPWNYLRTATGETAAIDGGHSLSGGAPPTVSAYVTRTLRNLEVAEKNEIVRATGLERSKALNYLSNLIGEKSDYLKLKNTTDEEWTAILSPEMNKRQLTTFFRQRDQIVKTVDQVQKKFGDDVFRAGPASSYKAKPPEPVKVNPAKPGQ